MAERAMAAYRRRPLSSGDRCFLRSSQSAVTVPGGMTRSLDQPWRLILKGIPMKLHTRMLTVLADDLAALDIAVIAIRMAAYSGLSQEDFDELKMIMEMLYPRIRLRMI
jgi:hypothetical protein